MTPSRLMMGRLSVSCSMSHALAESPAALLRSMSQLYSSALMRTQVRCVCLLINHLQTASGNVAESGFLFFQIPPHYPSRKNSVVNTAESKIPAKDLRSRVCNRHPVRPVKGVLLTPKVKKIGRQTLVKSVCRW